MTGTAKGARGHGYTDIATFCKADSLFTKQDKNENSKDHL